ncbi:putative ribonuclease H-like domain-containing protein [Tanacetum coccineum]|uniref:Ribonuclease H-like domain-containing protein n=1 Tax=Tanacetum coccineum TaxID=301880 RepID=A0ABQ4Y6P5_9ASTR
MASNYSNCIKYKGVADKVTDKNYGVDDKGVADKVGRMVAYGMVADGMVGEYDYEKEKLNERIGKLSVRVGIIQARIDIWKKKFLPISNVILAPPVSVDDVTLVAINAVKDDDCFGVFTIDHIKEVAAGVNVAPTTTINEITLAQTLIEIKAAKPKAVTTAATTTTTTRPKARGVVVQEPSEFRTTTSSPQASQPSKTKDKGKAIMIEPEVPLKKKDQVALDEEMARNLEAQLQAELIEEERLARKKEEEANIALIESWENTQAMMEADRLLAERLQTREQEELTDEEKAKLFMEFMEKRRKHFAALRAQEKRKRPPTKTQKRNQMSIYLKHMGGYKHNQLKGRSYDEIQKLFDKEMKRVNSFVAMNSEAQEISGKKDESSSKKAEIAQDSSAKRAGDKLESDKSKKQKTDENEEVEVDNEAELKKHMVTVKDDDIAIDAIPLATKPPVIVEYKLIREGIMGHYQLIRADGSFKRYSSMIRMLQGIDREDLQTLWKLVKTKHGDTRPEDEHERVLWGDLKVMFEPDIKSDVWRNLQGYKVTVWKLFDSCGVHFVRFGNVHIFMLVEKRYPLTPITITNMLNKKLQADYWNEMCYQLLKLMFRGGLLGLKDFKMILRVTTAQVQDYALWEVIENGNSWVSVPQAAQENGTSVTKMSVPVTAKEKTNKKNDVKARSLLLMALPNERQLTFIWMNKAEIKTMSIDDLYNNFKIVEQSVKKSVGVSSGAQNLAFMTAPSTSSTNDVNTAKPTYEVSTVSPNVNTASPQVSTASFNDLEVMDLKWQLSLLSMREIEYFNYHKMGYFVGECRAPRNKEGQFRNQDNTTKHGNNKDTSSKAMLAIDGVGFDLSDIAEEHAQTNMALMAFSDSEIYNDKSCTKTCLKNYETLKKRKNEVLFSEEIAVLKREVACKDYEISVLKTKFEKVKQEKEGIEFKIEKFDNASKSLDKLLGSQITDRSKKGLGYNVVPLPHPLIYNGPTKLDLSYSGLDEFKDPEFKSYGSKDKQVSKDTSSFVESPLNLDKETIFLVDKKIKFVKPKNHEKLVKKSVSVKKSVGASSGPQNMAFMTALRINSTNDVNTAKPAYEVSTVSPNVNTASPQIRLEQFDEDGSGRNGFSSGSFSLLSMRANRECRAPRNKEGQFRNQDNTRKQGNNEDTSSKAMLAIDGVGFDWSDMAEEQVQTNMALMAFSDSELNQTEFTAATYKRGLATVEEQLITYRKNEVLFSEEVAVLKREVACKDYEINVLKSEFEKVKQEKEGIEFKIEKFDNASKSLNKLLESQITNKSKKGLGYNVVPPPHPLIYNRPKKLDLSYSGLDEFKEPEFKSYGSEDSKKESNIVCDKKSDASKENSDDSLVKGQVSEDTSSFVESSLNVDKETVFLDKKIEFVKPKNHEKPVKKSVRTHPNAQRNMVPRAVLMKTSLKPFNTARTVNTAHPKSTVFSAKPMSRFSKSAQSTAKAVNTARPHSAVVNAVRVNKANAVKALACWVWRPTKLDSASITFKKPIHDARGRSNGCSRHMTGNIAYLLDFKEFDGVMLHLGGGAHGGEFMPRAGNTARSYTEPVNVVRARRVNAIKTSSCWVWRPTKPNGASLAFKRHNYIDARGRSNGCSRHMTVNIPYLSDFKEFDRGYVTFRGGAHGGRVSDASYFDSPSKDVGNGEPKSTVDDQNQVVDDPNNENDEKDKSEDDSSPKEVNTAGQHVNTASLDVNTGHFKLNTVDPLVNTASSYNPDSPKDMFKMGTSHTLEATHVEFFSDEDKPEVDLGNILNSYTIPTTPNTIIHKDHPIKNVIGDVKSFVQIRRMTKPTSEQGFLSAVYKEKSHDTLNTYLYACFLSQIEPTSYAKALSDSSYLPIGKRAIGTKWIFRNKKDERGIVIRNKARLVAQGHRQEEGINYEEFFAPVARIEAIRLFLAYASFMGFLVYQMDVKSAFLYGTIEKEVYVTQPPGFKDPNNPDKVYKVVKALYGLHQAPRAWYETLANYLLGNGFKRGKTDQTLFIKKQKGDILLVQKFNYSDVKSASTPVDLEKPLVKDRDGNDVDVHLYRSMIGSLMYLTVSRPDIIYLKGKLTLGLWYSRDSPFELVAYTDSDYCKKQTVVATSTSEAEYVVVASCCGQVLWIQDQLLDYRYNFMNTMIHIDNNSTICIIENPVQHSKKLIQMVKIDIEHNVPDLLTKGFYARSQKEVGTLRYLSLVVPLKKVGDEAIHKDLGDKMERAATTASSLEAEQESGNINKTQSMATLNGLIP